jgi:hypothetical protein
MPCTYQSRIEFKDRFDDHKCLGLALKNLPPDIRSRIWLLTNGEIKGGSQADIDRVKQRYQVEIAKKTARNAGYMVTETQAEGGKIRLTVRA